MERPTFLRGPICGVAVTLTMALTGVASAHLGDRIFPIYELPTADLPDLHDGTLEDWEEVLPGSSLDYTDFEGFPDVDTHIDPSDLTWRVFLAWHSASQRLYVAIERLDDVYLRSETIDSQITFMLDGDHSGGQFAAAPGDSYGEAELKRFEFAQAQIYYSEFTAYDKHLFGAFGAAWSWVALPPWADSGAFQYGEAPSAMAVEFAVTPWDDLNWEGPEVSKRSSLAADRIVGFQIWISDIDEPGGLGGRQYTIAVPATFNQYSLFNAGYFVDGMLIPCHRGDCSEGPGVSVVQPDTWGRIKASFR